MTSQCSTAFSSAEGSTQKDASSGKTSFTSWSEPRSCAGTHRRLFSIASSDVLHRRQPCVNAEKRRVSQIFFSPCFKNTARSALDDKISMAKSSKPA